MKSRFLPAECLSLILTAGALAPFAANAAESGNFECTVRKAIGVKGGSGEVFDLPDAPDAFRLELADGPIFGDQLNDYPRRKTESYEPEERATMVARIDAKLFSRSADRLVSHDRKRFSDGGVTLALEDDGAYIVYGSNSSRDPVDIYVYAGDCAALGERD